MIWTKARQQARMGLLIGLIMLGGWLGTMPSRQPVLAQQASPYTGLDILFLVDQSGSMGGRTFDGPSRVPTDPLELRFESLAYAIELLGEYQLGINPNLNIRLGALYFGDDVLPIMSWETIAASGNREDWEQQLNLLQTTLSADYLRTLRGTQGANLGNTNFVAVFSTASDMFALLPPSADERLRVMILLTDGEPCVVTGANAFDCEDAFAKQRHMDDLIELAGQSLTDVDLIYVLTLDDSGHLWTLYHADWEAIARDSDQVWQVTTNQQVGVTFRKILMELMRTINPELSWTDQEGLTAGINHRNVPPYQRSMLISLFKSSLSQGELTVILPDGSVLEPGDNRLVIENQDRPIEKWIISNPPPGVWEFNLGSTQDQIDVFLDLIPIDVAVSLPPDSVYQFDRVPLGLKILDDQGNPLPNYPPPYVLTVEGRLYHPNGTETIIALNEPSQGTYEAMLDLLLPGIYGIELEARTVNVDGSPFIVYQNTMPARVEVIEAGMHAQDLPDGTFLVGEPITVAVSLTYDDGQPVENANIAVQALLKDESGEQTAFGLNFAGSGVYSNSYTLQDPGQVVVEVNAIHQPSGLAVGTTQTSTFSVEASQRVVLKIVAPADGDTVLTSPLYPLVTTDVEFQVEAVNTNTGERIDVMAIAQQNGLDLQFELENVDDSTIVPGLTLEPSDTVGVYTVTVSNLDLAAYEARIRTTGELQRPYLLDTSPPTDTVGFSYKINSLVYVVWGGLAAAAVLTLGGSLAALRLRIIRRAHPAQGKIILIESINYNETENRLYTINLDNYHSNTIVLKKRHMPRDVQRKIGLTQIKIVCPDEKAAKTKRVVVTVKRGSNTVIENRPLAPGSSLDVSPKRGSIKTFEDGTSYKLFKEFEDDAYSFCLGNGDIFG